MQNHDIVELAGMDAEIVGRRAFGSLPIDT
jgi:hypothetical protein